MGESGEKLKQDTKRFVKSIFSRYYSKIARKFIEEPTRIASREFGFNLFDKGIVRHLSFRTKDELIEYLRRNNPSDCYYSSALYINPTASMDAKGWMGAELIFDIDADHIPTNCKVEHDRWLCLSCGCEGVGEAPDKCPNCGGDKLEQRVWFCEGCLIAAKREAMKLLDILSSDFGIREDTVNIYFSGHRGFHIHVSGEVEGLDQNARREIADYLLCVGLDPTIYLDRMIISKGVNGAKLRMIRALYDFISSTSIEGFSAIGLGRRGVEAIVNSRDRILEKVLEGEFDGIAREIGVANLRKLIAKVVEYLAVRIDPVVTLDTHRLIRLPGSLHGKTGFIKARVGSSMESLEDYDPLSEAMPFRNSDEQVKLYVHLSPRFRVGEEYFGPFKDEYVYLPLQPALLLLCKGVAYISS
ncbi:hypothetical protein KEJ40_06560 [Candidatus Bathyarchaeota archaeon]|nr:hypothetical protein [Candidatus Bathyarchaeota archaeon]